MASLKFLIRKGKGNSNKDGTALIFLRYTHRGRVTLFSTKKKIHKDYWDETGQKAKRAYKGFSILNIYLSKFRQQVEDVVNKALYQGIDPTINFVKKNYTKENGLDKQTAFVNFESFCTQHIEESKKTKKPPTIRSYNDFIHVLDLYKKSRKLRVLEYEDFNLEWYYDFMQFYIEERGASNNTFGKHIKTLKSFLNESTRKGHNKHFDFRDKEFKVYKEEVHHIYLDEFELREMLDLDFSNNIKRQTIRDLFVVACYTGVRFGDFKQISQKNILNDRLRIKTQKTGSFVVVPLHPIVKQIVERYKGKLPNAYCNNVINAELKHIGKLAGIDEQIVQVRTHGLKRKETLYKKYELISSHCARRSFATNLFKQGFPAINIMKITGHKTQKSFMRYIKVTGDEVANLLEQHWASINNHKTL